MANILVVDDEPTMRLMLKLTLQNMGHAVQLAATGAEAAGKIGSANACQLVLLDHRLPDCSGLDVLKKVREQRPECPVVMITAYGTGDLPERYIGAGASAFLPKPFSAGQLQSVVETALASASADDA